MEDIQYNNQEVIIVGSGGLAREIISWNNNSKNKLNIIGFLDDFKPINDDINGIKILGKINFSDFLTNRKIIFGISNCLSKQQIFKDAQMNNVEFSHFIHDTCLIGERTKIGVGLIMLPYSIISCDTQIGNLVLINNGSQIGHDVIIDDYTSIMANVDIGGGVIIGKNVFIGSNAIILPGVKIPDNTIIGAGSVVIRSVKEKGTYFGNPAKKVF
jgi:sugar O-acyltransferase (sialic acid O-acetyltransferase NeuD family)